MKFECCDVDDQGEHSDACPLHFNRKTLAESNQRFIDAFAHALAAGIDSDARFLRAPAELEEMKLRNEV